LLIAAMKRAIHVIPDTSRAPGLEGFRAQFDSLYGKIRAHITLVFPFDLPVGDTELLEHCRECAAEFRAFSISLQAPQHSPDGYLWLPVEPSQPLNELTRKLHSGPLHSLLAAKRSTSHHITIARPPLPFTIQEAIRRFQGTFPGILEVTSFTLESILPNQDSLAMGCFEFWA
jgi:2'-5' RNA ligase